MWCWKKNQNQFACIAGQLVCSLVGFPSWVCTPPVESLLLIWGGSRGCSGFWKLLSDTSAACFQILRGRTTRTTTAATDKTEFFTFVGIIIHTSSTAHCSILRKMWTILKPEWNQSNFGLFPLNSDSTWPDLSHHCSLYVYVEYVWIFDRIPQCELTLKFDEREVVVGEEKFSPLCLLEQQQLILFSYFSINFLTGDLVKILETWWKIPRREARKRVWGFLYFLYPIFIHHDVVLSFTFRHSIPAASRVNVERCKGLLNANFFPL